MDTRIDVKSRNNSHNERTHSMKKLLITIPLYAVVTLAEAALLKLGVYIVHTNWWSSLPVIDYTTAVFVLVIVSILISVWKAGNALGEAITSA